MSNSLAGDLETMDTPRVGTAEKAAMLAAKLVVTGACFWYISRQIDLSRVLAAIGQLDLRWAAWAIVLLMLEIPLMGLRWRAILDALATPANRMTPAAMISASAIGVFFSQVLPSVAGEGVRAWLLVRLGCGWRNAVTSVVIDRAVGVLLLIAIGFVSLLLPSGLTALGGYHDLVLVLYGVLLFAGVLGLLLVPKVASPLARWRYSRWLALLAADIHRVLLGPKSPPIIALGCLIHAITIAVIWMLGRSQGLTLPVPDAMVLFTIMVGVTIVPISISGWGVRELAVIALLGHQGIAPEKAVLFSVGFGLAVVVASLPGAAIWLLQSVAPARWSAGRAGNPIGVSGRR